jgi:hypothetical protein
MWLMFVNFFFFCIFNEFIETICVVPVCLVTRGDAEGYHDEKLPSRHIPQNINRIHLY